MSSQQVQKEKVRIPIEENKVPVAEVSEVIENPSSVWKASGDNADFENTLYENFKHIASKFCTLLDEELHKPENVGKQVSFIFKNYMFGIKNSSGYEFLWRRKTGGGGGGGSQYGNKQQYPLAELYFGSVEECNEKLKQDTQNKWYYVDTKMDISSDGIPLAFVILKRNKSSV